MLTCYVDMAAEATPVFPIQEGQFSEWLNLQDEFVRTWVKTNKFKAKSGTYCVVPTAEGAAAMVLLGINDEHDFWQVGMLPAKLAAGTYSLQQHQHGFDDVATMQNAYMAWGLGTYKFSAYIDSPLCEAQLLLPDSCDRAFISHMVSSIHLVRDLINTPADDLGPGELANAVSAVATECDASIKVLEGDELLAEGFNAIHAVGRAAKKPPCLIDMQWGDESHPKLTLVGKGICFDSGGLDIKPASGMRTMKKDMGGSAIALGLARLVMLHKLPVRLRLLIAAAENAIGSDAYRPGDVIQTKAGLSVEIHNTDAEGRLVVGDALFEASAEKPRWLIDFTTLTGAARVALGPDLPVMLSNSQTMAQALIESGDKAVDPIWQLPLHQPYREFLKSDIADMTNCAKLGYAGAITAALYLQSFVPDDIEWAHFDVFGSNIDAKPGRPKGGEASGLRAVFRFVTDQLALI